MSSKGSPSFGATKIILAMLNVYKTYLLLLWNFKQSYMDTTYQDGLQDKYATACSLDQRVSDTLYCISWFLWNKTTKYTTKQLGLNFNVNTATSHSSKLDCIYAFSGWNIMRLNNNCIFTKKNIDLHMSSSLLKMPIWWVIFMEFKAQLCLQSPMSW